MEVVRSSETSEQTYDPTWCDNEPTGLSYTNTHYMCIFQFKKHYRIVQKACGHHLFHCKRHMRTTANIN